MKRATLTLLMALIGYTINAQNAKTRVIITSDAEIDDECSFVRCLLYSNEFDIEGIISTSSQYHAHDHNWAGDDWYVKYLDAYTEVYPNLIKHDPEYPEPDYLKARTFLGNVETEGEMDSITAGSQHIVSVLLDESDDRPIWLQAWGGMNTIARALKTIEEEHPEKMESVANKIRFFFIWEQDNTFQEYIKPVWGKYNIPTIISDQFIALFYKWKEYIPAHEQQYLVGSWMNENIKTNHGPLCSLYQSLENGDFRSEGDSPSFMHGIPTGLRNLENPSWGGWAGRYINISDNIWIDPVDEPGYEYPEGRWYTETAWGRSRLKLAIPNDQPLIDYLKPVWRWMEAFQNDFASRADWCVSTYENANHPPVVVLANDLDMKVKPGDKVNLSALGTSDPDGDALEYRWWHHEEAGFRGAVTIEGASNQDASFVVPQKLYKGLPLHIICEVTDAGSPPLTRYQRVVVETDALAYPINIAIELTGVTTISLSWDDVSDSETGFRIERAKGETGSFESLTDVAAGTTSYLDNNVEESSLYRYRLFAFNDSETSEFEGEVAITTMSSTDLPVAFSNLSPADNVRNLEADTTITWESSLNADSYDIYFGEENPPPFLINQTQTTLRPEGMKSGQTYYWKVDGKNQNGITEGTVWSFRIKGKFVPEPVLGTIENEYQVKIYPNPFQSSTNIEYELKSHSMVKLSVFDVMGKKVATLVNESQSAGKYAITFDGSNLENGLYFFSLKTGYHEQKGKLLLNK